MEAQWTPSLDLVKDLHFCGVDQDILNSLLASTENWNRNISAINLTKNFVKSAAADQISWSTSFIHRHALDNQVGLAPAHVALKKDWQPKEEVLKILCSQLRYQQIDIVYCRELFIRTYLDQVHRSWDCIFINFVFHESSKYFNDDLEDPNAFEGGIATEVTAKDAARSKRTFGYHDIFDDIAKGLYVTPAFKLAINDNWHPSKWVVAKLTDINIGKRFIYNDYILPPFINHYQIKGGLFVNYDVEYFHWVKKRHPMVLKLYIDQRNSVVDRTPRESVG